MQPKAPGLVVPVDALFVGLPELHPTSLKICKTMYLSEPRPTNPRSIVAMLFWE
jgi:hypothetical protein